MLETASGLRLFWPEEQTAGELAPFISVIVPVRNEERFIAATLAQLCSQQYDPERFEILIADGDSTDATREIVSAWAKRHRNVHLVHNPKRLSSAGATRPSRCSG